MNIPLVAIIGRPNVGKSTLFNRLTGSRKAIVGDQPGITRDRMFGEVEWKAKMFRLVDTGGIVPDDEAIIPANIFKQASFAIDESVAIIWVLDSRAGVTPLDEELGVLLRNTGKPVIIAANKCESRTVENEANEFYQFGFEMSPISAEHGIGTVIHYPTPPHLQDAYAEMAMPTGSFQVRLPSRCASRSATSAGVIPLIRLALARLMGRTRVSFSLASIRRCLMVVKSSVSGMRLLVSRFCRSTCCSWRAT